MAVCLFLFSGCDMTAGHTKIKPSAMKETFGTADGLNVYLFTLENKNGMTVKITNYGAIITSIHVPDRNGKLGTLCSDTTAWRLCGQ